VSEGEGEREGEREGEGERERTSANYSLANPPPSYSDWTA